MGKQSAEDVLKSVTASVDASRKEVQDKRRKRKTIADLCNLFEQSWQRGQKEANPRSAPARLVGADRSLLKQRIVYPFRDAEIDIEDFSYWVSLNWDAIGAAHFAKAKSYPAKPAFRWLVKCIDTYLTAYEQREFMDLTAKLSKTELLTKAKESEFADARIAKTRKDADETIASLKDQLREANKTIRKIAKGQPMERDPEYHTEEQWAQLQRKQSFVDYEETGRPARRKLKRKKK